VCEPGLFPLMGEHDGGGGFEGGAHLDATDKWRGL